MNDSSFEQQEQELLELLKKIEGEIATLESGTNRLATVERTAKIIAENASDLINEFKRVQDGLNHYQQMMQQLDLVQLFEQNSQQHTETKRHLAGQFNENMATLTNTLERIQKDIEQRHTAEIKSVNEITGKKIKDLHLNLSSNYANLRSMISEVAGENASLTSLTQQFIKQFNELSLPSKLKDVEHAMVISNANLSQQTLLLQKLTDTSSLLQSKMQELETRINSIKTNLYTVIGMLVLVSSLLIWKVIK